MAPATWNIWVWGFIAKKLKHWNLVKCMDTKYFAGKWSNWMTMMPRMTMIEMMTRRLKRARQQCFSSEVKGGTLAASQASEASQEDYFRICAFFSRSQDDCFFFRSTFLILSLLKSKSVTYIEVWTFPWTFQVASSYQSKKSTDGFKGGWCMWVKYHIEWWRDRLGGIGWQNHSENHLCKIICE